MNNRLKKKNSIILSALKLFSQNGFYNTSIANISKSIGISVGGIYGYFPSKKELAKSSIVFVTKKLAYKLNEINKKNITQREKISQFAGFYFDFIEKHPEMIDYFFRVYLANRELFCDEDDCGFSLAKDFVDEIENLINKGIENGEFKKQNFYVAFSCITGILGSMTFLNGEKVLSSQPNIYCEDISNAIYNALSV